MIDITINEERLSESGLIVETVSVTPPQPNTTYIRIPGRSGRLDLTEAFGTITYDQRNIVITTGKKQSNGSWQELERRFLTKHLGRNCKIVLSYDADHYYTGRLTKCTLEKKNLIHKMKLTFTAEPFRYKAEETSAKLSITAESGAQTMVLKNEGVEVIPTITSSGEATITFAGHEITVNEGTAQYLQIRLQTGDNSLKITGEADLTFQYREMSL